MFSMPVGGATTTAGLCAADRGSCRRTFDGVSTEAL